MAMAASVSQPIPENVAQEELDGLYEEVSAGFVHEPNVEVELASPYSDSYNPTGHFYTVNSSRSSMQPATPSSVGTTFLHAAHTPPPLPSPRLPRIDSPSTTNNRTIRPLPQPPQQPPPQPPQQTFPQPLQQPFPHPPQQPLPPLPQQTPQQPFPHPPQQPLPQPPQHSPPRPPQLLPQPPQPRPQHLSQSSGPLTPPASSPSTSFAAAIVPYVGVSTQPSGGKYGHHPDLSEGNGTTSPDPLDSDDESEASDIEDESGTKMRPLPPYIHSDPENTVEVAPKGVLAPTDLSPSNAPGPSRLDPDGSETYSTSRWGSDFYSQEDVDLAVGSDNDPSNHEWPNDFASDHSGHRGANIPRRSSRLILAGQAPFAFIPRNPRPVWEPLDEEEEEELEEDTFINYSLLSHLATVLRDKVPRDEHTKEGIKYPNAFTGKDIVSTIHNQISRELKENHGGSSSDRRPALLVARSLQSQLFFYEVEWGGRVLRDDVGNVYMFLDEAQGLVERAEIPTGVVTVLTKCYSPSCAEYEDGECYAYSCPRKGLKQLPPATETSSGPQQEPWPVTVSQELLNSLTGNEINRQTIIHKLVSKEEQYVHDLDIVESVFIEPLRKSGLSVSSGDLHEFIDRIFGNIVQIRDTNRRLLDSLYIRQREQAPVVEGIGDIFLGAASTEFKEVYPTYIGHHPISEKLLREELERNPEFRVFIETCSRRQITRIGQSPRLDLKHFLNRPVEHLQKYRVLLEAIYKETDRDNPDGEFLTEAIKALNKLQTLSQVHTFQETVMKGSTKRWEWSDLVTPSERQYFSREEAKRQSIIFELITTEMEYVKDLHNISKIFITPLQETDPPIIDRERLPQFFQEVFNNIQDITMYHQRLVDQLHHIQREYHPRIPSITAAVFDTALNFRDAYLEYIPNYPIAAYRIENEKEKNPAFKTFLENATRHPGAQRLDMTHFIYRPIPRLLRYELLLKGILDNTSTGHEDRSAIPNVIEILKSIGKDTEPGVTSAKQKVDLWKFNSSIIFKLGEHFDMDLLDDSRSLIHTGKLYRQPEGGIGRNDWTELFVILFDNYFVMTKPKVKDNVTGYNVTRRPIPLDLLSLVKFDDPPVQRPFGFLRNRRNPQSPTNLHHGRTDSIDSSSLFPFTVHHTGRLGGPCTLYAESAAVRSEWQRKLEEGLGLRNAVMESNKLFEIETLSSETFLVPSVAGAQIAPGWTDTATMGGRVTCSIPFTTHDNRKLVAIGCAEGVWIGFLHDPRSMRRVLHLRNVTQCAMLEDFGLFLVLADKVLFAYHIEALVPTQPNNPLALINPQRLNASKDVLFFTVGTMQNRTLVIYMKKRGTDSVFQALEPVADKITERPRTNNGIGSRLGLAGFNKNKPDWFRNYKDFRLPSECYDLIFLKARVAVLCQKGFEIMQIENLSSVTIPVTQDSRLSQRCESCRPLGMFRVSDEEFILCYNEFGLYVNKHGDPSRDNATVEWEGTADRVALHPPYILLFDPRFIEVRHVDTGRLAEIIKGADVRCVWDGRGADLSPAVISTEGADMSQEPRIHAVMNSSNEPQQGIRASRGAYQHVFELVPTIPLYLPDPIASPPAAAHFHPSFSPPRSPSRAPASFRS